jgi:hypothetical protein
VQVELIRAGNPSLSVDEFDARFDRARSRVRAVARSILDEQHAEGTSYQMGGYWIVDVTVTFEGQTDLVRFGLDL